MSGRNVVQLCIISVAAPLFMSVHCQHPKPPSKLLLLAEITKLFVSLVVLLYQRCTYRNGDASLPSCRPSVLSASAEWVSSAAKTWTASSAQFSLPGVCYAVSNYLSFEAIRRLPIYVFVLLWTLKVITTAALSHLLLQQQLAKQARWSLLLLLATASLVPGVTIYSIFTSSAATAAAPQPTLGSNPGQQKGVLGAFAADAWGPGLAAMAAVAVFSAGGSLATEWLVSTSALQASESVHLQNARLACWGVLLNGLWYLQHHSSSSSSSSSSMVQAAMPCAAMAAADGSTRGTMHSAAQALLSPACSAAGAAAAGSVADLGLLHWGLIGILAALGLVSTAVIKQKGALSEACLVSLAMLAAVSASQLLQSPPPPAMVYVAACLAAAAILQLLDSMQHQQEQQHIGKRMVGGSQGRTELYTTQAVRTLRRLLDSSSSSSSGGCCGGCSADAAGVKGSTRSSTYSRLHTTVLLEDWAAAKGFSQLFWWLLALLDRLALAAILLSLLLLLAGTRPLIISRGSSSGSISTAALTRCQQQPGVLTAAGSTLLAAQNQTTHMPMPAAVSSMPCVDGVWLQREGFCPVFNCSLASSCTVSNPGCCAHLNYQILVYVDALMRSRGMSHHYVIMYGTLLGAVRNSTIVPHTNDVDVAMSAAAIAMLQQPATKEELWRHGYVFWCADNVWRLCAHAHHPSPAFQQLLQPGQKHSLQGGPYMDVYLMWQTDATQAAAVEAAVAATAAQSRAVTAGHQQHVTGINASLPQLQPLPAAFDGGRQPTEGPGPARSGGVPVDASQAAVCRWPRLFGARRRCEWQLCFSHVAVLLSGRRRAAVEGLNLVVPDNAEQLLEGTYGPRWRTPNTRPYAPSYDEDECIAAVLTLNGTLFAL